MVCIKWTWIWIIAVYPNTPGLLIEFLFRFCGSNIILHAKVELLQCWVQLILKLNDIIWYCNYFEEYMYLLNGLLFSSLKIWIITNSQKLSSSHLDVP
jgi:hypothetical protein